ncbi:hypothetical protein [Gymnodinialimonas ulvae]|uniref:hypothetical protein n=1 Tax=Gymnodinialimonas ulvae TaxID=3126504 RepID=UPI0030B7CFDF
MPNKFLRGWKNGRTRKVTHETLGHLSAIEITRPENGRYLRNKAGRAVITGLYNGVRVKAFQAHSVQHAIFISDASSLLPEIFPHVHGIYGRWIFAEWAEGTHKGVTYESSLNLFSQLHAVDLKHLPATGFDYLEDYIIPRFLEAATLAGKADKYQSHIYEVINHSAPRQLSHPDLTLANVVYSRKNLVSIDNELLSSGKLPLLDACNCAKSLDRSSREVFWEDWIATRQPDEIEIRNTSIAWLFREVGSCFISGRFDRCNSLLTSLDDVPEQSLKALDFPLV